MTGTAAASSQGASASVCDVLRVLQQDAPADRRRPQAEAQEADSEVSLMIIAGSARLVAAMMWERKDGSMWRKMIRIWLAPASSAAVTKSSSRSARNWPRTTRARSVQPSSEMMTVMAK